MKRLALSGMTVAGIWTAFQFHASAPGDPIDLAIIAEIGEVFALAALVMVLGTPTWSARAAGLFWSAMGIALLFGTAAVQRARCEQGAPEWVIDLARACFIVGGALLLYGIVVWFWVRFHDDDAADTGPPDGLTE